VAGTFNIVRVAVALPYVGFWQILLQKFVEAYDER
jgi:hypothetical protein